MKRILAMVALALPIMAAPVVTYTTTGTFGSSGGSTNAGGTLMYKDVVLLGGGTVDLGQGNPTTASLGELDATIADGPLSIADTFTLTVTQTGVDFPPGSGTFNATISGTIAHSSSQATIDFTGPTAMNPFTHQAAPFISIGGVNYILAHPTFEIVPPTTAGGVTTLQAAIVGTAVPEPTTMALMGLGLIGLGIVARRRRA